jgi:cell division septum initiation protein DivIVA
MAVTLGLRNDYRPCISGFDRRRRMATQESGPAPSATAGSLNLPTFGKVRRGYDPDQVLEYVTRLTDHLDALETEVRRLQGELSQRDADERAGTARDEYEGVGARVADLMRTFDQDVGKLRQDAEAEAERVVAEARIKADRIQQEAEKSRGEAAAKAERVQAKARAEADEIRLDAQSRAEEVRLQATEALAEAKRESERVLSSLSSRHAALMEELRVMRDGMIDITKCIEATIESGSRDQVVVVGEAGGDEPADLASSSRAAPGPPA